MSKFKIIEEGRLSTSEMKSLKGGACNFADWCESQARPTGYNANCNVEIKQQMTPNICNSTPGLSYGCFTYNNVCKTKGSGACGNQLGIIPK